MNNYKCNYCNKEYKSHSARGLHYNLKHKEQYEKDKIENKLNKEYKCNNCYKIFSSRQSKYNHKKHCNIIKEENNIINYEKLQREINELKKKLEMVLNLSSI
jgi:hypothetical protein